MDQQAADALPVEVVYATQHKQRVIALEVAAGSSARDVVRASDIAAVFPEAEIPQAPLGIWGEACDDNTLVRAGDRVEIYRALPNDPRALRMRLVAEGKTMGTKSG
ncbi:MAG: RnfH family protein [Pseudomonadota bacterium]